jgi:hypothetical protein
MMEETLPRIRAPNPHLGPSFPRRRTQIAMGRSWNRELFVEKEFETRETVLEPRSHESVIKTGSIDLTGIENRSDRSSLTDSEDPV